MVEAIPAEAANAPVVRKTEVLIIGSGAGGSVTALELARAGRDVLVLEEGRRVPLSDYGQGSAAAMKLLYRRRGMTPIMGGVPIGYVEGCCVGGSTEINSGFWHRTPPETLLRWKARFDLGDASVAELAPHFDWAEQLVKVSGWQGTRPTTTRLFARGVEAMDWSAQEVSRAAHQCQSTNACSRGCPRGAKQGMSRNLIPAAEAAGARIMDRCAVRLLLKRRGRVTGALAEISNDDGTRELVAIEADHVFVCAGATETPGLLRRSGIHRNIGNSLSIHPMLKMAALFDEDTHAEESVLPLIQVKEFWPDISLGGGFFSSGHLAMQLGDNWDDLHDRMRSVGKMATFYVAVRGMGRGLVRPSLFSDSGTTIRYDLGEEDVVSLSKGLARLAAVLLAAGAREVYPGVRGLPVIRTPEEAIRWLDDRLPKRSLNLTTVHAFSSCPMGEQRERCAVDSFGKVSDFENLYINDASMLPDSPGVNPQGTIMALARRNVLCFISGPR